MQLFFLVNCLYNYTILVAFCVICSIVNICYIYKLYHVLNHLNQTCLGDKFCKTWIRNVRIVIPNTYPVFSFNISCYIWFYFIILFLKICLRASKLRIPKQEYIHCVRAVLCGTWLFFTLVYYIREKNIYCFVT